MGTRFLSGYSIDDLLARLILEPSIYTECYRTLSTGGNSATEAYFTGEDMQQCAAAPWLERLHFDRAGLLSGPG